MKPITVAIADRDHTRRVACFKSLENDRAIRIVAGVASRFDVVEAGIALRPSIIVCGMELAADFGHWLLRTLHCECPRSRVLLVTDTALSHDDMARSLVFGPSGLLPQRMVARDLARAIRGVARGEAWLPRKVLGTFVEQALG